MKIPKVIGPILKLLTRLFIVRMVQKYIIRTGHPVVLAYSLSALCFLSSILLFVYCMSVAMIYSGIPKPSLIVGSVSLVLAIQFLLSAMEMDFNYNRALNVRLPRKH